ncbi:neurofilament heavy polypeptide-like [Cololabis saira]|uniref:neurofilament heavy polypeptide-like n=1 Tax=Cololabis saira TaxID=129043 RepID=UPI002AD4A6A7|nr:neurofilament heavy polypeptide-like [Cololabis saira]
MKVEPRQQYLHGAYGGFANTQVDFKLEVRTSFTPGPIDYQADLSLQVCHCGWTKLTSFRGLRIHQGKKGCTEKRLRVPKKEQYHQEDRRKPPARERVIVKEEVSRPPRMSSSSAAAAAFTVKEEYKSPPALHPRSSRGAPRSSSAHQPVDFSILSQVNRPARKRSVAAQKKIPRQASQKTDIEDLFNYFETTAARIKEEPKSPFAPSDPPLQRTLKTESVQQLQDFSGVQVQRSYREPPAAPAVRPKERSRRDPTLALAGGSFRQLPPVTDPGHEEDQLYVQVNMSVREDAATPALVPVGKTDRRSASTRLRGGKNETGKTPCEKSLPSFTRQKAPASPTTATDAVEENKPRACRKTDSLGAGTSPPATRMKQPRLTPAFTPPQHSLKKPKDTKAGHQLEDFPAAEQVNTSSIEEEHPSAPTVVPVKRRDSASLTGKQETPERSSAGQGNAGQELTQVKTAVREKPATPPAVPFRKKTNQKSSKSPLFQETLNYSQEMEGSDGEHVED